MWVDGVVSLWSCQQENAGQQQKECVQLFNRKIKKMKIKMQLQSIEWTTVEMLMSPLSITEGVTMPLIAIKYDV